MKVAMWLETSHRRGCRPAYESLGSWFERCCKSTILAGYRPVSDREQQPKQLKSFMKKIDVGADIGIVVAF